MSVNVQNSVGRLMGHAEIVYSVCLKHDPKTRDPYRCNMQDYIM